ncbi:kinase-like protein [Fomitiporia mediterranea MF3/22]|uniref:kinase-like protein n=1 Tax=Fomitiporia mediterranea (strain MF3/22) TaxID=694068 RepID=UPI00044082D5|nr:kinase-like protein [Fomitiporia mediterranea MF3/22]EJD08234.1 kinase-like protein [Fomitiporia mediterranea MF3/22]
MSQNTGAAANGAKDDSSSANRANVSSTSKENRVGATLGKFDSRPESVEYKRIGRAGSGYQSDVLICEELVSGKPSGEKVVAKKEVPKYSSKSALEHETFVQAYLKEKLNDSAYNFIVKYKGLEDMEDVQCLLFEYLEGGDIKHYIESPVSGEEREKQIAIWMRDILVALAIIHSLDILHRDVKPNNMIHSGENGSRAKLADFGSSAFLEPPDRKVESSGAYKYRSPEGHLTNRVNDKADIFALGLSTYELLSRRRPYIKSSEQIPDREYLNRIRDSAPDFDLPELKHFSAEAIEFLKRTLEKDPEKRPNAVTALQDCWFRRFELDPIVRPGDNWWLIKKTDIGSGARPPVTIQI